MQKISLLIIGAGNLGSRLVELFANNYTYIDTIYVASHSGVRAKLLSEKYPGMVHAVDQSTVLDREINYTFLCCKPKDFIAGSGTANKLCSNQKVSPHICSMLAGVSLNALQVAFPKATNIIRAMPNLALSFGRSVTGFIASVDTSEESKLFFQELLSKGGFTLELQTEEAIDALTAMASSGLAYFAKMSEALAKTAQLHGFSESEALSLATQTLIGAGVLAEHMELPEIRKQVATKGGTTERALAVFDNRNFDQIVEEAVEAAMERAKELRG